MRDFLKLPRSIAAMAISAGILLGGGSFLVATAGETGRTFADADTGTNSPLLILWGLPGATRGDAYTGPGPTWWLGGGKAAGEWTTNGWSVLSNAEGSADQRAGDRETVAAFWEKRKMRQESWLRSESGNEDHAVRRAITDAPLILCS